jgi:heme-degrading monooxygenase HmoA
MAVVVTMEVGPVDWSKFQAAMDWMNSEPQTGLASNKVYRSEDDPNKLLVVQEWDSHDSFHAASDKYGDEFNRRAGTEGLDWRTGVWTQ